MSWADLDFPLQEGDVADSTRLTPSAVPEPQGLPLHVGWVCSPPGRGSGGHTTLFRMVHEMEIRGHRCTLFLYDRNADDVERHVKVIRTNWPWLKAEIRSAASVIDDVHAVVASSWPSAHVVASRAVGPVHRFYFIQDYEPYFYPRGALYALAEDTYRFGFTNIALGEMVAASLVTEVGVAPDGIVPFGCDTDVYGLLPAGVQTPRNGVVFYVRKSVGRRGYLLGKMALERFHRDHPEQEIHTFGDSVQGWPMPVTHHGTLSPSELNQLYNRTIAGLAFSFTNISLAAEEMLAAGTIPVINDSQMARADLTHPGACWAQPTPGGLADALAAVTSHPNPQQRAASVSREVGQGWAHTGEMVTRIIEDQCMDRSKVRRTAGEVTTSRDLPGQG